MGMKVTKIERHKIVDARALKMHAPKYGEKTNVNDSFKNCKNIFLAVNFSSLFMPLLKAYSCIFTARPVQLFPNPQQ